MINQCLIFNLIKMISPVKLGFIQLRYSFKLIKEDALKCS